MKARYKLVIVIILLWLGMTYEGSRATIGSTENRAVSTLQDEIRAYENRVVSGGDYTTQNPPSSQNEVFSGNFFSRLGRNIGRLLQTAVRETLRAFIRFFDGVIS